MRGKEGIRGAPNHFQVTPASLRTLPHKRIVFIGLHQCSSIVHRLSND